MRKLQLSRRQVSNNASLYIGGLVDLWRENTESIGQMFLVSDSKKQLIPCSIEEYRNWASDKDKWDGNVVLKSHEQYDYRIYWCTDGSLRTYVVLASKDVMCRDLSGHEWSTVYALSFDSLPAANRHFGKLKKRLSENEKRIVSAEKKLTVGKCYDILCHATVASYRFESDMYYHPWCGLFVASKSVATKKYEVFLGRVIVMDRFENKLRFADIDCVIAGNGNIGEALQRMVVTDGNDASHNAIILAKSSQNWDRLVDRSGW